MSERTPVPKPLYDTIRCWDAPLYPDIKNYIKSQKLPHAEKEYQLTKEFLSSYSGSEDTFNAYRREVERLLHWTWLVKKGEVNQLTRHDISEYLEFVMAPLHSWIALKNVSRFILNGQGEKIANPQWRPFVMRVNKAHHKEGKIADKKRFKLTNKSIQALFAILSTYFTFLQQEDYMRHNPVTLIRQKSRYIQKTQQQKVTRRLSPIQWRFVIEVAENLANQSAENERILFMFSAFYLLGLRISELADTPGRYPKMCDFAPDKRGLWWFTTVGKGNKIRDVAVPDTMLAALKRYRISLELTSLPNRGDDTPILHKQRGRGGLGTRQIRNLVQKCFDVAETRLLAQGQEDAAQDLRAATVHWLRHTAISADIEFRPREHVRDDVGHGDPATTEKYIDADRISRHQSAQGKKLIPENEESG